MEIHGSLKEIKVRESVTSDIVNMIRLEVHGEIAALHGLMGRTLKITIEPLP